MFYICLFLEKKKGEEEEGFCLFQDTYIYIYRYVSMRLRLYNETKQNKTSQVELVS